MSGHVERALAIMRAEIVPELVRRLDCDSPATMALEQDCAALDRDGTVRLELIVTTERGRVHRFPFDLFPGGRQH